MTIADTSPIRGPVINLQERAQNYAKAKDLSMQLGEDFCAILKR